MSHSSSQAVISMPGEKKLARNKAEYIIRQGELIEVNKSKGENGTEDEYA